MKSFFFGKLKLAGLSPGTFTIFSIPTGLLVIHLIFLFSFSREKNFFNYPHGAMRDVHESCFDFVAKSNKVNILLIRLALNIEFNIWAAAWSSSKHTLSNLTHHMLWSCGDENGIELTFKLARVHTRDIKVDGPIGVFNGDIWRKHRWRILF